MAADIKSVGAAVFAPAPPPVGAATPADMPRQEDPSPTPREVPGADVRSQITEKRRQLEELKRRSERAFSAKANLDEPLFESAGGERELETELEQFRTSIWPEGKANTLPEELETAFPDALSEVNMQTAEFVEVQDSSFVAQRADESDNFDDDVVEAVVQPIIDATALRATLRSAGGDGTTESVVPVSYTAEGGNGLDVVSAESVGMAVVEVDVAVTESAPDDEEVARERSALLLDAILLTAEATLGVAASRTLQLLTPEEARSWELLRAFRFQASPKEQRAARAKELMLDELVKSVSRR